jgi:hypothetical protein
LREFEGPVADDDGPVAGDRIGILRHPKRHAAVALPGRRWIDCDPGRLRGSGPRTLSRRADRRRAGAPGRTERRRGCGHSRLASLHDARTGHARGTGATAPYERERDHPQNSHGRCARSHGARTLHNIRQPQTVIQPDLSGDGESAGKKSAGKWMETVRFLCAGQVVAASSSPPVAVLPHRGVSSRDGVRRPMHVAIQATSAGMRSCADRPTADERHVCCRPLAAFQKRRPCAPQPTRGETLVRGSEKAGYPLTSQRTLRPNCASPRGHACPPG